MPSAMMVSLSTTRRCRVVAHRNIWCPFRAAAAPRPPGKSRSISIRPAAMRAATAPRRYLPDFIVRIDDGHGADDPLNLVVEIKGFRGLDAQLKAETMATLWVPGVNNLKTFGRWSFAEFRDAFAMEVEWGRLVTKLIGDTAGAVPA